MVIMDVKPAGADIVPTLTPDVNTCLLQAVQDGELEVVQELLLQGGDPNFCSPSEDPLLLVALKQGHDDVVSVLLASGATVDQFDSNGKVVLHYLACTVKTTLTLEVLAAGAQVDIRDSEEKTPLHYAAAVNQAPATRLLLQHGAHPDLPELHQMTPLTVAAKHGSTEVCELLLAQNVDVNHRDSVYCSALHHACRGGCLPIVRKLMSHRATLSQNNAGDTELMLATEAGALEVIKFLLLHRADVNQVNRKRMSALHYAARAGCVHSTNMLLCTPGIRIDLQERKGMTPLMLAARHGHHEVMAALITAGAHVPMQDSQLLTSLHHAALQGHVVGIMLLLKNGARIDQPGENGNPPLILAACNGHIEAVKLLLNACKGNQYLNVNSANHDHMTALHMAADRGHTQCAEALLQEGGDPGRPNRNGDTPLMLACRRGNDVMVGLILNHLMSHADPGHCLNKVNLMKRCALHAATRAGTNECIQMLLTAGAVPDVHDVHGKTPLILAAELGHDVITDRLLRAGADVSTKTDEGWTALHLAAQNNAVTVAAMLLGAGADPDVAVWVNGITPVLLAAARGHYGVLKLLLRRGADPDLADFSGMTALHKSARGGHALCARLLVVSGARVDSETTHGRTPAMVAVSEGHRRALRVLLEANCDVTRLNLLTTKPNKKFATIVEMLLLSGAPVNVQAMSELVESSVLPVTLVENPSLRQRIIEYGTNPLSLRQLSRSIIRAQVGYDIAKKVPCLPLPVFLQDYVLLKELRQIIIVDQPD